MSDRLVGTQDREPRYWTRKEYARSNFEVIRTFAALLSALGQWTILVYLLFFQ